MSGHIRVLWTEWKQSVKLQFLIFTPNRVCVGTIVLY